MAQDEDELAVDFTIAAIVAAVWVIDLLALGPGGQPQPLAWIAALAGSLPLAFRRREPLVVAAAVWTVLMVQTALGVDADASVVPVAAIAIAMYGVGAYEPDDRALTGLLGALMAAYALVLSTPRHDVGDFLIASVAFLVPILAGRVVRRRRAAQAPAADALPPEVAAARGSVALQRTQIAGEARRVVAAEIARLGPPDAVAPALAELDRLTDLLGIDGDDDEPLPGLDDLEALVERTRAAGGEIELRRSGDPRPVPAGIGLTLHRIADEALANVLQHARPRRATVELRWTPDAIELEVLDDGRPLIDPQGAGGRGLLAMRERATAHGGTFYAARRDAGGFRIRVRLPL
ncbi:sensor histidine kinase [Patulibacter defluvii]|uniref:sensor histidine kinase n=1 Tax=Patulibacter defluvii TaxID=3095358 RepID=UPI002A74EA75|nr:ATP-binding protein [Patulibacter sp. DM4]